VSTGLTVRVEVPPVLRAGTPVRWSFTVANEGPEPRTLVFPSGQQGEITLLAGGVERYRWSRGLAFVQMISERRLEPGETWGFSLEGELDVEPGRYSLVASVVATPSPPPVHAQVSVS
jgi:hypothetical protein